MPLTAGEVYFLANIPQGTQACWVHIKHSPPSLQQKDHCDVRLQSLTALDGNSKCWGLQPGDWMERIYYCNLNRNSIHFTVVRKAVTRWPVYLFSLQYRCWVLLMGNFRYHVSPPSRTLGFFYLSTELRPENLANRGHLQAEVSFP